MAGQNTEDRRSKLPTAGCLLPTFQFSGQAFSQTLNTVESVEYDSANHRWLASNGSSVISVDGNGDEVDYFGSDPEADYGMEVMNDVLYTIVGSSVRGYALADGAQVFNVTVAGADFLNGMASNCDHTLWITDFGTKKIHEIDVTTEEVTEVVSNTTTTPNGIVYDEANNRLVFVNWGSSSKIKAVSLSDYAVTTIITSELGNCDGIDNDLNGNFYVSSWSPTRITRFSNEFAMDEIITAPGISQPADIAYAEEIDSLGIANAGNSSITFVGFSPTSVNEIESNLSLRVFPNPVTEQSVIEFQLTQSGRMKLEILDATGRQIKILIDETLPATYQKILMAGIEIEKGFYFYRLQTEDSSVTVPFVK